MALTKKTNIVIPEVMGDAIDAKVEAMLKITPFAKLDTSLQGVPGDTKTVPAWNYIGDAEDVAEGEAVTASAMTCGTREFTIKKAMKQVRITEESVNSGLGDPIGQAEKQLAARTELSTPPESARRTFLSPTCWRMSSTWSATKFFMFQLASALHVSNTKSLTAALIASSSLAN